MDEERQFLFGMHAYDGLGSTDEQIKQEISDSIARGHFIGADVDARQLGRELTREELEKLISVANEKGRLEDVKLATEKLNQIKQKSGN